MEGLVTAVLSQLCTGLTRSSWTVPGQQHIFCSAARFAHGSNYHLQGMPSSLLFSPVGSSLLPGQLLFWKLPEPVWSEAGFREACSRNWLTPSCLFWLKAGKKGIPKISFGKRKKEQLQETWQQLCLTHLGPEENVYPHLFDRVVSVVADDLGSCVIACPLQKQSLRCVLY